MAALQGACINVRLKTWTCTCASCPGEPSVIVTLMLATIIVNAIQNYGYLELKKTMAIVVTRLNKQRMLDNRSLVCNKERKENG
jgi:hypothetical protein